MITFKGKNITDLKTHELMELGITYVPQGKKDIIKHKKIQNVYLGGRY
jgi:ABC-type branched-subunit amino acid transport system ATPase component